MYQDLDAVAHEGPTHPHAGGVLVSDTRARQRLREVLKGPIVVTPVEGGWTFRGWVSFEAIWVDLTGQT